MGGRRCHLWPSEALALLSLTFCPGEQSSSKAVINRGQGLGLRVEGQRPLVPGLGKPETNLGQD